MRHLTITLGLVLCVGCSEGPAETDAGTDAGLTEDAGSDAGAACFSGANDSLAGRECNCMADCVETAICASEDMPGGGPRGSCLTPCTPGSDECGAGYVCPDIEGSGMGVCREECATQADCDRPGWQCLYGNCSPLCTSDAECLSGHCDPYDTQCDDGTPGMGAGVLQPCSRDEDCLSSLCLTPIGGYCVSFCIPGMGECPDGAVCVPGVDAGEPELGICMPPCSTAADCPGDLSCLNTPQGRVCFRGA